MKLCWHKWSKWSEAIESYGGSLYQISKCDKCGAITKRRAISIFSAQLHAHQVNAAIEIAESKCVQTDPSRIDPYAFNFEVYFFSIGVTTGLLIGYAFALACVFYS